MKKLITLSLGLIFMGLLFTFTTCKKFEDKKGCQCEETKQIATTLIVSKNHPTATLSVYNETGDFTADGGCHALMDISFRWADTGMAKTDERPPITYRFETPASYFPVNQGMENVNIDASGYYNYGLQIDEAENAINPKETSYAIIVKFNGSGEGVVTCRASIFYKHWDGYAHTEGCTQ